MKHVIERTSPKGSGQRFIGTCRLCGTPNLPMIAVTEDCPNQRGLTSDEALMEAITGKPAPPQSPVAADQEA